MPTASSPVPRSASTQPMPPQYGPRGAVSSASMIRSALDLGAPVTEPGGKVGGEQLRPAGASGAARRGRWRRGGPARDASRRRTGRGRSRCRWRRPGPRSLRTRSTIITFSAWSFSSRSAAVRPVPLIGPDSTVRPVAPQDTARGTRWRSPRRARAAGSFRRTGPGCRGPAGRSARRRRRRPGRAAARTAPGRGSPGRPRRPRCARGCGVRRRCTRPGPGRTSSRRPPGPRQRPGTGAGTGSVRTSPKRAQVRRALEVGGNGPEAGGVEGRGIAGDIAQAGGDEAAEAGQRSEVVHVCRVYGAVPQAGCR